ncbi:UNVERIFIED_CONTAM: Retrovirus-related Pol polyprotein from transposon TNT 1-94 [Sesamum angustifolium]|uniref:Retrovirus-related Pol polyprotein from transposon TNT 1-94 n=1 Tax=Sesamum angustifolium TaxID=2727405 RepID=A0AAW2IRA9_9LAMI
MTHFTELPLSFWGYTLETVARLLNIAPSKTVAQTPYQIWHGKPASYKHLRVWGSPRYVKRLIGDKLDLRSSLCRFIGYLKETIGYYFMTPLSKRSAGVPQPLGRYGFLGMTGQLDNDPKTYGEAMSEIDSGKWLEAMKSKMDSMSSNQVWKLLDRPKDVRPIGCKWVYKRKIGADGEVTSFKAKFVAKGYNFARGHGQVHTDYACHNSMNDFDPCVYKKVSGSSIVFLVLYVDDILLIGNDIKMLGDTKAWLSTQFSMKDLGEASYILGIKIYRDRSKRILGMTENSYIEKVLKRFKMKHSKRGFLPMRHGVKLSKNQSPKTDEKLKRMLDIPYASAVGSIQYVAKCTRPDIAYTLSITSRYQPWAGSFQSDDDDAKSQSGFVFKLSGSVVAWKSSKQDTTADSTTEAKYKVTSEAAKEVVWMKNYIEELGVYLALPSQ